MSIQRQPRTISPPDLPGARAVDASVDHALALLLAHETEGALRWCAAALEEEPSTPGALIVTSLLLWQMGRTRAAIDGLGSAVRLAIAAGNLPLAIAAIGDLRTLGADVTDHLDQVSMSFCRGSGRVLDEGSAPPLADMAGLRPLSPFLAGPALASRAAQILKDATHRANEVAGTEPAPVAPLPLFSELSRESLRELLAAFEMITVPAGEPVVREGEVAPAAYIVARGELEVSRRIGEGRDSPPLVLTRLSAGAFFGEMALLSRLPSAVSVVATRPSILLVARRDAIEPIAARHPETAVQLAAHCRRQAVSNLGWASPVLSAVPAHDRAAFVELCETRIFSKGEKMIQEGDEAAGLHLVVSGEVAVIGRDGAERVVLATLTAGETVGEVELVLCRRSIADAIATRPTATLFLPRDEFFTLVDDHPGVLHALYAVAVRRHFETRRALEAGSAQVDEGADDRLLVDEAMLRSNAPPPMAAAAAATMAAERPILPSRIVSVPAPPLPPPPFPTRTVRMAAPTSTLRMPSATPPGSSRAPTPSGRRESAVSTRAVSVQAQNTMPPTSASSPPVAHPRRSAYQAVAAGAFAAVGGVVITLVALHGRLGDTPGAAFGAAARGELVPAPAEAMPPPADPRPSAADATQVPAASATALSSAPRVSRSMSAPAPSLVRAPALPHAWKLGPAPTATPVGVTAAPAASLAPAVVPSPPPAEPKHAAASAATSADEFGGRE